MEPTDRLRLRHQTVLSDDWGVLTRHDFDLRLRNGQWQRQSREVYDRGNGATCLLFDPRTSCVLLTRQFRLPVFLNGGAMALVEAPAGLLEQADPEARMRAELIEETGYRVGALRRLFDVYMSPGSVSEYLVFFLGTYDRDDRAAPGGGNAAEGEDIDVIHLPLAGALAGIREGTIRDAKTIILVQHLALNPDLVA